MDRVHLLLVLIASASVYQPSSSMLSDPVILEHPKSRLIPIGQQVTFVCKIKDPFNPHWRINGRSMAFDDTVASIREQGYFIEECIHGTNVTTLILRVDGSADKHGDQISCISHHTTSDTATLLIILDPPLPQNPYTKNVNASTILFEWSPPYLWPGQSVEYYKISISGTTVHRINATFSDRVVPYWKTVDETNDIQSCNELIFSVSAMSDYDGYPRELRSFNAVGGYLPNTTSLDINITVTVLFHVDRSPLVIVKITFPQLICSYQQLINYTTIIEGDNKTTQHGPYRHYINISDTASHTIISDIKGNKEYTLKAIANTAAGDVTSQVYYFNTSFPPLDPVSPTSYIPLIFQESNNIDEFLYKVMFGVFAGVAVFLLSILVSVCFCILRQRQKYTERVIINSASRVCNVMTHNPIYDGPLYDSITTQFDNLTAETSKAVACMEDHSPHHVLAAQHQQTSSDTHKTSPPIERYVEYQTTQLQNESLPSNPGTSSSPQGIEVANTLHTASACNPATKLVMENIMEGQASRLKLSPPNYPNHSIGDHTTSGDLTENGLENEFMMLELSSSASANLTPAELRRENENYSIMSPPTACSGSNMTGSDCGSGVWLYSEV